MLRMPLLFFVLTLFSIGSYVPIAGASSNVLTNTLVCSNLPSLWSATAVFETSFTTSTGKISGTDTTRCINNGTFTSTETFSAPLTLKKWTITITIFDQNGATAATGSLSGTGTQKPMTLSVEASNEASATGSITFS